MSSPLPNNLDKAPDIDELTAWEHRALQLLSENVETLLVDRTVGEYINLTCNALPRTCRRLQKLEQFLRMVDAICIQGFITEEDARKIATQSHQLLHPEDEEHQLPLPPPAPELPETPSTPSL